MKDIERLSISKISQNQSQYIFNDNGEILNDLSFNQSQID